MTENVLLDGGSMIDKFADKMKGQLQHDNAIGKTVTSSRTCSRAGLIKEVKAKIDSESWCEAANLLSVLWYDDCASFYGIDFTSTESPIVNPLIV